MSLEEFIAFVDKTLDELILYAEVHAERSFSNHELAFEWESYDRTVTHGRENIIYEITDQVFVSEEAIYPCVDLVIEKPTSNKNLLKITGRRAGYEPRPFGKGWSNRPGPFIYGIGKGIKSKKVNTQNPQFQKKLSDLGLIHYEMKKP
ncbi:hypothetical protein GCM10027275_35810 [Rhabdobacter roseus]|uniref:Uncharacterized protein n=1 Tax=Rhabdobacter roseus TaxID=1655419 RepID=A0A840TT00_9BACT|nr:hypothetical protein [Rhabdobacter roseus]MBB5286015.1 hypothetical protein [Rhabdobacter roseus]